MISKFPRVLGLYLLTFVFCPGTLLAQSVSFPMNHWVYPFLDKLITKGIIEHFQPGTKPYTRSQIAEALAEVLRSPEKLSQLNDVENSQLDYLKLDFLEELSEYLSAPLDRTDDRVASVRGWRLIPSLLWRNGRDMVTYQNGPFSVFANYALRASLKSHRRENARDFTIREERHGINFWGRIGESVAFSFQFLDATQWGGRYPELDYNWTFEGVGYAQANGDHVFFDETQTEISIGKKFWRISLGKGKNYWGPGKFGSLTLSDGATSYDQVKLQLFWKPFRFTAITGFLQSYPPIYSINGTAEDPFRTIRARKYLAAHRLEMNLTRSFILGLSETLVYGERSLELGYLNPINFYWSAEHNLGDQDNSALSMDLVWFPGRNIKLYTEIFLDDLQTGKILTDWYGNKWALLAGVSSYDFLAVRNLNFFFEFTRIRPYVYTHKFPINRYKHFSTLLGHPSGPNSQSVSAELEYQQSRTLLFSLRFNHYLHGANTESQNVGGDPDLPHRLEDHILQPFFEGILEKSRELSFTVQYEFFRNALLRLQWHYRQVDNFLDPFTDTRLSGSENQFVLNVNINAW